MQNLLIEPQYAGSLAYFSTLLKAQDVVIDIHEHYKKGTYRNRCHIMGANGLLNLSIPLIKGKHQHSPMQKVRISYAETWQKDHWMSLTSAYRRSPYFEYYEHEFQPFYESEISYLLDFNLRLMEVFLRLLKLDIQFSTTDKYLKTEEFTGLDARSKIHPNPEKNILKAEFLPYQQVFMDRMDFLPNLSIYDLLFNMGPRAKDYLQNLDVR